MGKDKEKKKNKKIKLVEAEIEISMYCNACERSVAKTISEIKGVETFTTDMRAHRVKIKGRIIPEKLVKKLEKKTGKKVGILSKTKDENKEKDKDEEKLKQANSFESEQVGMTDYVGFETILPAMFSDENPNACSMM